MNNINSQIHFFFVIFWYSVFAVLAFKSIKLAYLRNERGSDVCFVLAHVFGIFAMLFNA